MSKVVAMQFIVFVTKKVNRINVKTCQIFDPAIRMTFKKSKAHAKSNTHYR